MRAACITLLLTLTACAQFSDIDGTISADLTDTNYPPLVPLDPLLASAFPDGVDPNRTTQNLEARVSALKARTRDMKKHEPIDTNAQLRLRSAMR